MYSLIALDTIGGDCSGGRCDIVVEGRGVVASLPKFCCFVISFRNLLCRVPVGGRKYTIVVKAHVTSSIITLYG